MDWVPPDAVEPTQDLLGSRKELQAIADLLPVSVARCTRDYRYRWVNRRFAESYGKPREATIGASIADVIGSDAFQALKPHFDRALAGEIVEYEREVEYAGLGRRWIRAACVPTRDNDGTIDGWVVVVNDLTEHRLLELAQTARDAADDANRTKGRFLSTASHDLRQPLQTISLLNGVLRRLLSGSEAAEALVQQEHAITSMARLLNALLDISKLESGAVRPQPGDFTVNSLFDQLRDEFSGLADSKGLTFKVTPCEESVHSDPVLVGQILRNLVSNAIKYTRQGSVVVRCLHQEPAGFRIEILDTGVGIPADQLPFICDEFFQVGGPHNPARQGYGLGLSIVQRLITLLDLELHVQSEVGRGSRFTVTLPTSRG
jgi:PAS domain S-box-containing protein